MTTRFYIACFIKRRVISPAFFAFAMATLTAGCASYTTQTTEIRSLFRSGQFDAAIERLEDSDLRKQARNRLLYRLEKAMILDRMGDRAASRKLLIEADQLVDELYTVSLSAETASFLVNDSMSDYRGEDYEVVAIQLMLALSFIEDGQLSSALVAARRLNTRLNAINQRYDKDSSHYYEDAFARFLAAAIYQSQGEVDSAIIDYAAALNRYEQSYQKYFQTPVPQALVLNLMRLLHQRSRLDRLAELRKTYPDIARQFDIERQLSGYGQVIVIHEVGSIALKQHHDFVLGFGKDILRFSFPHIVYQPRSFGQTGVRLKNAPLVRAELSQNMDAIAHKALEDRRLRLIAKQGARLVVKSQMRQKAEQHFGPLGGLAANIYTVVTETADTRSWSTLASRFLISRVYLKPGEHDLEILTAGRTANFAKVTVSPDSTTILRSAAY